MQHGGEPGPKRRLRVDLVELETAFDDGFLEHHYYLDLETGEVVMVDDEARRYLEEIDAELEESGGEDLADFEAALEQLDLPDWQRELVREAARVDAGFGTRYVEVPRQESREGYADMEEFVETVRDARLQDRLWRALRGRGAFRRFKDVLEDHPREQERWFSFRDARARQRVLDWLDEEGIEPIDG